MRAAVIRPLYRGHMAVDLAAAVPSVRTWRYGALPEQLSPDQVQQVLDCRDRGRSIGRRDYAVLLLLARLGLRANEIATLTLDDVDWHSGRLAVSGKGRCRASLPLLSEVGTVLAGYLEHGRPHSDSRRVFVRSLAPHTGFASSSGISMIAAAALSRAGLDVRRKGTHILIDRYFSLVIERLGREARFAPGTVAGFGLCRRRQCTL
jgi:site-specific recombinase XerD